MTDTKAGEPWVSTDGERTPTRQERVAARLDSLTATERLPRCGGRVVQAEAAPETFFVSPADDLVVIFLTQPRPSFIHPIRREPRATVYASIVD
jgi:hypothetical protein